MNDDIYKNIKLPDVDMPQSDVSFTANLASGVQNQIEKSNRITQQIANEAYNNRQKMQRAIEQTAANTEETNAQLNKVIENQNSYIDILKKQLEFDEQQLTILKNIFASEESGVNTEKEIMKLIQKQIDSNHPLWDFVKDKGGDVAVAGVTAGIPVIYNAIKAYFMSKGILLP